MFLLRKGLLAGRGGGGGEYIFDIYGKVMMCHNLQQKCAELQYQYMYLYMLEGKGCKFSEFLFSDMIGVVLTRTLNQLVQEKVTRAKTWKWEYINAMN